MIVLGIESTAHTFGVGIVNQKGRVLANEKASYTTTEGGIHPRAAADHHWENAPVVIRRALSKANLKANHVDAIAFAQGPGLGPCLEVAAVCARFLALKFNTPLVCVNHPVAHLEIAWQRTRAGDPVFVYSSGANTQILCLENGYYRVLGETLDIGVGNALDNFGRAIGMGFPAGPELDKRYFLGKKLVELPYSVKGMDLAYAGLVTSAAKKIKTENEADLVYSFVHTAFAMLTEVTERALAHAGKNEIVLTGGVAASKALREMMKKMAKDRGARLLVPEPEYCTDNGAMIAWTGLLMHRKKIHARVQDSAVKQDQRADHVQIRWHR